MTYYKLWRCQCGGAIWISYDRLANCGNPYCPKCHAEIDYHVRETGCMMADSTAQQMNAGAERRVLFNLTPAEQVEVVAYINKHWRLEIIGNRWLVKCGVDNDPAQVWECITAAIEDAVASMSACDPENWISIEVEV